ncbi:hypothetical protein CF168_08765 [Shewanella bicestrii]|uniref:Diguanylate phosphodiesterase n=1 Tax=Shewanella bicestrii TaxID=2018305 RepID=A0A220ULB6_9GAMM|nr:hypothetical protein [Shewanella bicestrii]ASK68958.1 hypothetical protein CF168_08765 [Shewanella bicestrii]
MKNCYILKSCLYESTRNLAVELRFKYQNIFSTKVNGANNLTGKRESIVGVELLLDFNFLLERGVSHTEINDIISLGEAAHSAIDYASQLTSKGVVFINLERSNLCDVKILNRVINLNKMLNTLGVQLVIEITERNYCGRCLRIIQGLTHLRSFDVKLACDDYNFIGHELGARDVELLLYYDYIKLEMPVGEADVNRMNEFIKYYGSDKKIILEKIEENEQLNNVDLDNVWGLQGFAYCKGIQLPKNIQISLSRAPHK